MLRPFSFSGARKCPEIAKKCLKCGFWHSDPAVVGRKSGSPESAHADICIIIMPDKEKRCAPQGQAAC
jgi:hypothetical protein